MTGRKFVHIIVAVFMLGSLIFGSVGQTQKAAAAPTDPRDESLVPHYYGPYPNWANSPQVLADAIVNITAQPGDPGFGAEAVATVNPANGAISAVTVTASGSGYIVPPQVSIDAAGVVPTLQANALADISLGVVTGITVDEAGFGFFTPTVIITGGGVPSVLATAQASGGVDYLTLVDGGSGYLVQPVVEFSLPQDPLGVQATAVATMDVNGAVDSITIVDPGSGYYDAPTLHIWDGQVNQPPQAPGVEATAVASIGITAINMVAPGFGGEGYDSVPTVTIQDFDGTDKFASATAAVSVRGGVTAINLVAPNLGGLGYLTPGLKKFVDPLAGVCDPAGALAPVCSGVQTDKYIPFAVPDTTTYPGSDYYEIALVQYREKLSSQLPATLLRGYVQLSTGAFLGAQVPLTNANLNPALPDDPAYLPNGVTQALGVDYPHYLGPTIVASKDRPVRILFRNLLPTGAGGDLFMPVDTSLMGAGEGPALIQLDPNGVPMDMAFDEQSVTDGVRNPYCGERDPVTGDKPSPDCFRENRATLHLHGGITPWISDGTPHQWTTPANENTTYPQGVSVSNVPDMPDPGPGALTFFYTNQQSARLMFYHDHAWGITRLNVYAGEAAGYLVTDAKEQELIGPGGALEGLGVGTPLIIQDKTFVPSAAKMAVQDPTWQYNRWGGEGNLWVPHVYMPAQNPGDPTGMSGFGRWMYGPFFWPPADAKYAPIDNPYFDPLCDPNVQAFCEPQLIPGTPNISVGMEAFNDTPLVNGVVYPTTNVDPKAYRYRILNAANDRFFNLSWYLADPRTGTLSEVALNPAELAAAQTDPVVFPTPDTAWSPPGPNWIQIGTEGGFLPEPVVIPAQPTTWITDPTRFDVGNVDQHSLLLAPAERADVIVDFSRFRGKTLILYNDAPAAFPARVPSYDYYTGGPDLSPVGVPTILPGYGPNTRTIMQVKVSSAIPAVAFDRPNTSNDRLGALMTAWAHHADGSGVFESSVDPIVVGQAAYNSAYGSNFVASGWCNSPSNPSAQCDGYARISEQGGFPFKFDTLGPLMDGTGPQISIPLQPKGIHDEMNSANFDEFGRMTANIGLEAPGATPLLQNIILYPYVNPATEVFDATGMPSALDVTPISVGDDGTQIWKITHNGVDTHPIHFHLYNVQVLNRVGWDNIMIPPDPTELGWKDTVRISPLQDTYVVMRPIVPVLPFAVPDSERPLNPMMPIGARGSQNGPNGLEAGFNNTDAAGLPIAPIINEMTNFYWEYVFHCHILSHEEMDMMRPQTVFVARELPDAPVLTATPGGSIDLAWSDGTPITADPLTWGSPKAEIGYRIERAINSDVDGVWEVIGTALANQTTFTDPIVIDPNSMYEYRVVARNAAGETVSNVATVLPTPPAAPDTLVATPISWTQVDLTWADLSTNEGGFRIERAPASGGVPTGPFVPLGTVGWNVTAFSDMTTARLTEYAYQVFAFNRGGDSAASNMAFATTPDAPAAAPTGLSALLSATLPQVDLAWTDNAFSETGFSIYRATVVGGLAGPFAPVGSVGADVVTFSDPSVAGGTTYDYVVYAFNSLGNSAPSNVARVTTPTIPNAPSGAVLTMLGNINNPVNNPLRVRFVFFDNATTETGFAVERSVNGGTFAPLTTLPIRDGTGSVTFVDYAVAVGNTYAYRVKAMNGVWGSAYLTSATISVTPPLAPSNLQASAVVGCTNACAVVTLTWTDNSNNESGFELQRATNATFTTGLNTWNSGINTTSSSRNVNRNRDYWFRIRSVGNAGTSAWVTIGPFHTP